MKKSQKFFVRAICVLLAVLMALSLILMALPGDANAVSQSEIDELQSKIEMLEQQITEQQQVIDALTENKSLIVYRKAALDEQIGLNKQEIALLTEQIEILDNKIAEKEQELEEAQSAENEQSAQLRERMRIMEEKGDYDVLTFIFQAESLTDLLARIGDYSDIMRYDKELETSLRAARTDVEEIKSEYEQAQAEQALLCEELDAKQGRLDAQVSAACELITNLDELSENAEAEYAAIAEAEEQAEIEHAKAVIELAKQNAALKAWLERVSVITATGSVVQPAAGDEGTQSAPTTVETAETVLQYVYQSGLIWPTTSTRISSNFGYRNAPTAGASSYHQAIDIDGVTGDPIYAAADGYISVATYNSGLGNYITIEHDESTSTRYAHMDSMIVSPGQYVTQGQIIGYMGETGIATGDHLDYAVKVNGSYVDPMQYYGG